MSRRLVIMRHAKAEQWGASDRERALAERGRVDSEEAGRWLEESGFRPDAALVSDASRARETWAGVAEGGGWALEPMVERGLYDASPESALDLIHLLPPETAEAMVVGHNPTMASLAQLLDDGTRPVPLDMPTSAVVVFELDVDWADLGFGDCRHVADHVGRG